MLIKTIFVFDFLSFKLAGWFADLKEKIIFINNWQDQGIPSAFWLPGFYFPQALLTGTLQNFARKHVVSIDTIDFGFKVCFRPLIKLLMSQHD